LQTEKRSLVLLGLGVALGLHIAAVYWWFRHEELWRPLALMPLMKIPGFWQAAWIIVVNGELASSNIYCRCIKGVRPSIERQALYGISLRSYSN
jgi:hypothetical protein